MSTITRAYLAAHPGDYAGAAAAGYIAALRELREADPHAIPTQNTEVQAAMTAIGQDGIRGVESWLAANWNDIEEAE
ncbi:hypothetical protein [Mycobacteroides abscessus]